MTKDTKESTKAQSSQVSLEHLGNASQESSKGGGISLLGGLALVGVVVLGYFGYQEHQANLALKATVESFDAKFTGVDQSLRSVEKAQQSTQQVVDKKVQDLNKSVQAQNSRISQISGDQDWKLHEARFLAVMAIERLQAFKDVKTATQLLENADTKLQEMGDPRATPIRQAIANDLSSLKSTQIPDTQGIWVKLGALSNQLDNLSFYSLDDPSKTPFAEDEAKQGEAKQEEAKQEEAKQEDGESIFEQEAQTSSLDEPASEEKPKWRQMMDSSIDQLKSLVVVKDFNVEEFSLALTNKEQQQLLASLRLMVEQAKWASLNQDQNVYTGTLDEIRTWVDKYFVQDKSFEGFIQELDILASQSIEYAPPDVSASLVAIDGLIQNKNMPQPSLPEEEQDI